MLKDLAWIREGKDIIIPHEPDFPAYPLTGKKLYLGVKNDPHTVSFYLLPIHLWEDLSIGWWAEDLGQKWADAELTKEVIYYPGYSEYNIEDKWLSLQETIFVPELERAGVIMMNLTNNSDQTKSLHLFVDVTSHLSYYHTYGTPAAPVDSDCYHASYFFASLSPQDVQDPGLDHIELRDGILISHDSAKPEWTAILGSNRKPSEQYLSYFDRTYIENGHFINEGPPSGVVKELPRCCLQYNLVIEPNQTEQITIVGAGSLNSEQEALESFTNVLNDVDNHFDSKVKHYKSVADVFKITTPDKVFNKMFTWSRCIVEATKYETEGLGEGYLNAYPHWWEYFGRDIFLSMRGYIAAGDFKGARIQFRQYIPLQLPSGEIPHELVPTGVVGWWDTDTTSLFIIALKQFLTWSGDLEFMKEMYPTLNKAVEFLFTLDKTGNFLLNNRGETSSFGTYGSKLGAQQLIDQIYFAKALIDAGSIAGSLGMKEDAEKWLESAERVKHNIETLYWNEEHAFYGKEPDIFDDQSLSIWVGMGVLYDIFYKKRAEKVMDYLDSDAFSNDCGTLMISRDRSDFYHAHLLWSWPTGLINTCEFRNHRIEQGTEHLLKYAAQGLQAYPGAVSDLVSLADSRKALGDRIYSFAINSLLLPAVEGLLGILPDMTKNMVTIDPHIPYHWKSVSVTNIPVGDSFIYLDFIRGQNNCSVKIASQKDKELNVRLGINLPLGIQIERILLDGNDIRPSAEVVVTNNDVHINTPVFKLKKSMNSELRVGYKTIWPYYISSEYKILDSAVDESISGLIGLKHLNTEINEHLESNFYAPAGVSYTINYKSPRKNVNITINGKKTDSNYDEQEGVLSFITTTPNPLHLSDGWKMKKEVSLSLKGSWQHSCYQELNQNEDWYKNNHNQEGWEDIDLLGDIPKGRWSPVTIPPGKYLPPCWYKRGFKLDSWKDGRTFLVFKGLHIFKDLEIYVNEKEVHGPNVDKSIGAYDFSWGDNLNSHAVHIKAIWLDVTEEVKRGENNFIAFKGEPVEKASYIFEECQIIQAWNSMKDMDNGWQDYMSEDEIKEEGDQTIWFTQTIDVPEDYSDKKVALKLYSRDRNVAPGPLWMFVNGNLVHFVRGINGEVVQPFIHKYLKFGEQNEITIRIQPETSNTVGFFGQAAMVPIYPIKISMQPK